MVTRRLIVLAFGLLLPACHGIEHPQSPISPTPRSTAAARLSVAMNPGELPVGGGSVQLFIEALGADGLGVSTPVSLEASGGELGADHVTTDVTGHAIAAWQGTASATLTARAGAMIAVAPIHVQAPIVLPPPSVPPPAPPPPTPDPPQPAPTPALRITVAATPFQVEIDHDSQLEVTTSNLAAGESVVAYQWDWDGNGTVEETSAQPFRLHTFRTDGIITPNVSILTSSGRTTSGTGRVVVYRP